MPRNLPVLTLVLLAGPATSVPAQLTPQNAIASGDVEIREIWAPEMHENRGKYYLFLIFNTNALFPEQWRTWRPRVKRGSQVRVSDSPLGTSAAFENQSILPVDMMTLDGTTPSRFSLTAAAAVCSFAGSTAS